MFSVAFVCLSICLLAMLRKKSYERIVMTLYRVVQCGKRSEQNFSDGLDYHADCPVRNPSITQQFISRF